MFFCMMLGMLLHSGFLPVSKFFLFICHYVLAYVGFLPPPEGLVAFFLLVALFFSEEDILAAFDEGTHFG